MVNELLIWGAAWLVASVVIGILIGRIIKSNGP